jgi:membrane protein
MKLADIWALARDAVNSWVEDRGQSMGAALAYYTLFSLAPLLLIVIGLAGVVFGADAARGEILDQLRGLMGDTGATAVQTLLDSVRHPVEGAVATAVRAKVRVIGATSVFAELQGIMDRIWRAPEPEGPAVAGLWRLLRARLLSFGMILGIGFLLIVSLVFSAALTVLDHWLTPRMGSWLVAANVLNFVIGFGMTSAMFAMIYKIMPRVHLRWDDVWVGALVTATLFIVGKFLIGLYVSRSGVASGFGAAGSLVVVLVWVYYSAQIFLIGAEFTWVYAYRFGSRRDMAVPPVPAPRSLGIRIAETSQRAIRSPARQE